MMHETISPAARRGAAAIAAVAAVTLATRLYLRMLESATLLDALAFMSQYFTILTNLLTLLMMTLIAMGRNMSPRFIKAVVIAIVCVGLFYHALLAHLVNLSGLDLWADHGTHTFVPLLAGVWWLLLAPKGKFRSSDVVVWIIWPLIYCIYILVRAEFSQFYPYPFLNLPEIGWSRLLVNLAGLFIGFIIVGMILTGVGRLLSRRFNQA